MNKIIVRVISQKGTCESGHRVRDEFIIEKTVPPGMCPWAFQALFAFAMVLQFGGSFPWEEDPDKTTVACPDPGNPVVFELTRVES